MVKRRVCFTATREHGGRRSCASRSVRHGRPAPPATTQRKVLNIQTPKVPELEKSAVAAEEWDVAIDASTRFVGRAYDGGRPRSSSPDAVWELVDAVQRLSLARSVADVQEIVRTTARRLTKADGATFVLREGNFCYYADEDAIEPLWKGQRFPLSACISGWAMLNKRPAVIDDIYADERIPHDAYRPTFVKSLAMVPIRTLDPIGAIGNYWAAPHVPSRSEVKLLQALADSTAVAMENIRIYDELEHRVRDRTAELETANQRLHELDSLRTRFVHTTIHELRTPLTSIHGFALVLTEELEGQEREFAGRIYGGATQLSAIVDDLLTIAELEHEQLPIERQRLNLAGAVSGSVQSFDAAASRAGLVLTVDVEDVTVEADPLRLAQILGNLISNAIKYTPTGGHIHVSGKSDGSDVVIVVADDGIGISDEDKSKLFQPFFRTNAGRESASGTGLGLNVSRSLAEAHNGSLTVTDSPGGGTTFVLRLPREQ
jgi:signal transduction histidine kinase